MPSLNDSLTSNLDLSGYEPVERPPVPGGLVTNTSLEPGPSIFLRTPIPPVWSTPSDSLRTFFNGGKVPQYRIMAPGTIRLGSG